MATNKIITKKLDPYDFDTVLESVSLHNKYKAQFEDIHSDMTRNYNMTVSKYQWDKDAKDKLDREGRPANAYNLLRSVIRFLSSEQVGSRKRLTALPQTEDDFQVSQVLTHLLTYFTDKTNFDYHLTRAFIDAIIAKYGFLVVSWSFENDPLGQLEVRARDPRSIMFDLNYADTTLSNCSVVQERASLSLENILNKYAHKDFDLKQSILNEASVFYYDLKNKNKGKAVNSRLKMLFESIREVAMSGNQLTDNTNLSFYNWFDSNTMNFDVLETHERRTENLLYLYDSQKDINIDITEQAKAENGMTFENEKIDQIKKEYNLQHAQIRSELNNVMWITTTIPALQLKVYDKKYPININKFLYVPVFAYDYHADLGLTQSVVDDLVDPQSDYNKARSTKLELLQRYISKGWVMEDGAIDGFEEDWTAGNLAPFRRVNPGYWNKIRPEEQQTISPDLIRESQESPVLIESISGVNPTAVGQGEPEVSSGKHYIAKANRTEKSFSYLFEHIDQAREAAGEVALSFIQKFVSFERSFRITQNVDKPFNLTVNQSAPMMTPEGQILIKKLNDISVGKYDIKVDSTPYGSTAREMEFLKFMELFKMVAEVDPQKAAEALPILIKASDTPYREDFIKIFEKKEENPVEAQMQQIQQAMMQLELLGKKLTNMKEQKTTEGIALDNEQKKIDLMRQRLMTNLENMYTDLTIANSDRENKLLSA